MLAEQVVGDREGRQIGGVAQRAETDGRGLRPGVDRAELLAAWRRGSGCRAADGWRRRAGSASGSRCSLRISPISRISISRRSSSAPRRPSLLQGRDDAEAAADGALQPDHLADLDGAGDVGLEQRPDHRAGDRHDAPEQRARPPGGAARRLDRLCPAEAARLIRQPSALAIRASARARGRLPRSRQAPEAPLAARCRRSRADFDPAVVSEALSRGHDARSSRPASASAARRLYFPRRARPLPAASPTGLARWRLTGRRPRPRAPPRQAGLLTDAAFCGSGCAAALAGVLRWLELLAISVFVLEQTGSPFLVALLTFLRMAPMFLCGIPAGALADRYDRRRLLIIGLVVLALTSAILAAAGRRAAGSRSGRSRSAPSSAASSGRRSSRCGAPCSARSPARRA